jgi:hypothetical protein
MIRNWAVHLCFYRVLGKMLCLQTVCSLPTFKFLHNPRYIQKQTKTKFQFTQRIFELSPDTFRHQLESVQREQLKIHVQSITPTNGLVVKWMDYPENPSIIDPMEDQSDYYDRSKAVFFVCVVYFWDHQLGRVSCVSHTCVTPDMRKRNEQVTQFIHTIFEIYNNKSKADGHGRIKFLSLWSDNCGDQFKIWLGFCICSTTRTASNILQFLCPRPWEGNLRQ